MAVVSQTEFARVCDAFRAKLDFEKALAEYKSKGILQRLVSARPVDPVKGFDKSFLKNLVNFSFESSHPELNFQAVTRSGLHFDVSTTLNAFEDGSLKMHTEETELSGKFGHVEKFQAEKGQGFVYEALPGERQQVEQTAMGSRPVGSPFDQFHFELDKVRYSNVLNLVASGMKADAAFNAYPDVLKTVAFKQAESIRKYQEVCDRVEKARNDIKVESAVGVVSTRMEELKTRGRIASSRDYRSLETLMMHDVYSKALSKADKVAIFEKERLESSKARSISLDEIMSLSQKQAAVMTNPNIGGKKDLDYETLVNFTENALNGGYSRAEIEGRILLYRQQKKLGKEFSPAYDLIVTRVAGSYVEALVDQTDTAFGNGLREAAKIDVLTPYGNLTKRFSEVHDMALAADFLDEQKNVSGNISYGTPKEMGSYLFASGSKVSPESLAVVAGLSIVDVVKGYNAALGSDFVSKVSGVSSFGGGDLLPVRILANDILQTAKLISASDVSLAGSFLRDAGFSFTGGPVVNDILDAARNMYQRGDLISSIRTDAFRSRWSEYINTARQQSIGEVKMKVRNGLKGGFKIS